MWGQKSDGGHISILCPVSPGTDGHTFSSSFWRWENQGPDSWRLTAELDKAPKVNASLCFGVGLESLRADSARQPGQGGRDRGQGRTRGRAGHPHPGVGLGRESRPPNCTPGPPTPGVVFKGSV